MTSKTCRSCDVAKPLADYHRNRRSSDWLCRICKPCAIAVSKQNYRDRQAAAGFIPDARSTSERFLDYVHVGEECWTWVGPAERDGHFNYGRFSAEGVVMAAHRWSYALHCGDLPADSMICHHCDNPSCVNPDHLYAGDARTNAADAAQRGRISSLPGEANPSARLTPADVSHIRERAARGETQLSIALDLGVSHSQVNRIVNRKSWTNA